MTKEHKLATVLHTIEVLREMVYDLVKEDSPPFTGNILNGQYQFRFKDGILVEVR